MSGSKIRSRGRENWSFQMGAAGRLGEAAPRREGRAAHSAAGGFCLFLLSCYVLAVR